jgi:hypothetical protein
VTHGRVFFSIAFEVYFTKTAMFVDILRKYVCRRVRKIVETENDLFHACSSVRPPVCMEQLGSSARIFMKFDILGFSKMCGEN